MYDANGNVIAKRTLEHTVTRYEYDSYNRKSKEVTLMESISSGGTTALVMLISAVI